MTTPNHAVTLHFQCSFELRPMAEFEEPWTELVKTLRHWVSEAPRHCPPPTDSAFYSGLFFTGGQWKSTGSVYHCVDIARMIGKGSERNPEHWALRYEHSCDSPGRIWRIDAGVTQLEERRYRVSIVTSHYMRPGFIGREPPAPRDDTGARRRQ